MRRQWTAPISRSCSPSLPPFPAFAFPSTLQVSSGHVLQARREVSYLVLSPRLCLGSDLSVCVCVVHNGRVYIGFSVHVFILACAFVPKWRLFLFPFRQGDELRGWKTLCLPSIHTDHKRCCMACRMAHSFDLEWILGFDAAMLYPFSDL